MILPLLGARLKGRFPLQSVMIEPWLRANVWRAFGGEDRVTFDHSERIETRHSSTRADLGAGVD